jgi:hypothetical protein
MGITHRQHAMGITHRQQRQSPERASYISDGHRPSTTTRWTSPIKNNDKALKGRHISAMGIAHRHQRWASPIDISDGHRPSTTTRWASPIDISDGHHPSKAHADLAKSSANKGADPIKQNHD